MSDTTQPEVTQPEVAVEETAQAKPAPMDIGVRVGQYVQLRDQIKKLDDEHKAKMLPYRQTLEMLNALMLDHLNTVGGDSVSTGSGTVYRTTKKTASLQDGDAFMRHVIGSEAWELLDRKANVSAVEAFVKENGVLPPGVKWSAVQVVGVRRS